MGAYEIVLKIAIFAALYECEIKNEGHGKYTGGLLETLLRGMQEHEKREMPGV